MIAQTLEDPRLLHQMELERLYSKNQLMPRVRQAFLNETRIDFKAYLKSKEIPEEFGIDLMAQMAVRKRAQLPTLVGVLRYHFDREENPSQACSDMLVKAIHADLVDYVRKLGTFIVRYTVGEKLQAELDKFQYPLPMVVSPDPVTTNLETGYLTEQGSVILRDNYHTDDVCLDHLNRVNQIGLCINLDTAQKVQNQWRNLDKKKLDETWEVFQARKKAFQKYDSVAKGVIDLLIQEGNELYLTHRYDKRGRTYCMGHHITYQGTDWNKAILEFADKEPLEN